MVCEGEGGGIFWHRVFEKKTGWHKEFRFQDNGIKRLKSAKSLNTNDVIGGVQKLRSQNINHLNAA